MPFRMLRTVSLMFGTSRLNSRFGVRVGVVFLFRMTTYIYSSICAFYDIAMIGECICRCYTRLSLGLCFYTIYTSNALSPLQAQCLPGRNIAIGSESHHEQDDEVCNSQVSFPAFFYAGDEAWLEHLLPTHHHHHQSNASQEPSASGYSNPPRCIARRILPPQRTS